ncbi:hypothetical protein [Nesterenkonia sp. Act20]|uniref:hypothetical protein n=1 Tax=Nesterenkonia sp. Act20 TaxID=1483432 RepID=UPI001C4688D5|nr:hypothetical protein [Nesterenkonia sp. Act20]
MLRQQQRLLLAAEQPIRLLPVLRARHLQPPPPLPGPGGNASHALGGVQSEADEHIDAVISGVDLDRGVGAKDP